jgi:hypothetical protein
MAPSGSGPLQDGKPQYVGRLGKELDADAGRDALRTATLNALSAAKEHLGSLDRVSKVIRVGVYLATSGDFYNQPILRCIPGPRWQRVDRPGSHAAGAGPRTAEVNGGRKQLSPPVR